MNKIMLKDFFVIVAIFKIIRCENLILPQVYIPDRGVKLLLPKNPPKPPLLHLLGQKFSLPRCCQNASEWEDIELSLQILTDYSEPDPERSTFASLINLIKFILIKEELSCIDAMKGPIVQVKRPEGEIFKAVSNLENKQILNRIKTDLANKPKADTKLENKQILNRIETALANKSKYKAAALPNDFYDNIDISNMIPIWRPRNTRRKNQTTDFTAKEIKSSFECNKKPKDTTNLDPSMTVISGNMNPVLKEIGSKPAGQTKVPTLTIIKAPNCCELQCLPLTNIKPVTSNIGCGGNCNLCKKFTSPILSGCPNLASATVLSGCPKTNMVLGCPCVNILGCPNMNGCQPTPLHVMKSETMPVTNWFGNCLKKVTSTVLVPYTVSQLVA